MIREQVRRRRGRSLARALPVAWLLFWALAMPASAGSEKPRQFSPILWAKSNTLGTVAFEKGDYRLARERFEEALALARLADPRDEFLPISLNNLSQAIERQGDPILAETLLTEALSACRGAGFERPHSATAVLLNLSTVLCAQNRCGEAADYIEEARSLREDALAKIRAGEGEPWEESSAPLYLLSAARKHAVVPILYATNRQVENPNDSEGFYGNQRGDLQVGVCDVAVPLDHRMGTLAAPTWWKLEFSYDPDSHVTLLETRPREEEAFRQTVRERLRASRGKRVFVFVHGFNTTFPKVARRAAQLSYDLGFDGVPVVFCWPSQGELSESAYIIDRQNAEWASDHLADFLAMLSRDAAAEGASVALVSHSLGSQPLARALQRIATREEFRGVPRFREAVFTAPDMDAAIFRRLAPDIMAAAERVTLYVSANDKALNYSRGIYGGLPRAGYSDENIFLMPGIDTIEVSDVDSSFVGHGYYGENRSVLSDVYYLIATGAPPDERHGLTPMVRHGQRYWKFRP